MQMQEGSLVLLCEYNERSSQKVTEPKVKVPAMQEKQFVIPWEKSCNDKQSKLKALLTYWSWLSCQQDSTVTEYFISS